jgi:hypothetical protein
MDLPDYFYEIDVPPVAEAMLPNDYTALLRVVNAVGLPVTEEQEIRLTLPEDWVAQVPEHCRLLQEAATASKDDSPEPQSPKP